MSLNIKGKQILANSIELDRLNLNNYNVGDAISGVNSGKELTNREYVDQVLKGLSPKESVRLATSDVDGNIDLVTGGLITIDTVLPDVGDRILVKNQSNTTENGVYIASLTGWSRSEDFDGNPTLYGEIQRGDYIFAYDGFKNKGYSFIVISSGSLSGNSGIEHNIGVDPIIFTEVSEAETYVAGDGIDITTSIIKVDILPNGGLVFDSALLKVDPVASLNLAPGTLFGNGIDYNSEILSVGLAPNSGLGFDVNQLMSIVEVTADKLVLGDGALQINASTIPLLITGSSYLGSATNIQDALEEIETSLYNINLSDGSGLTYNNPNGAYNLGGPLSSNVVIYSNNNYSITLGTTLERLSNLTTTSNYTKFQSGDNIINSVTSSIELDTFSGIDLIVEDNLSSERHRFYLSTSEIFLSYNYDQYLLRMEDSFLSIGHGFGSTMLFDNSGLIAINSTDTIGLAIQNSDRLVLSLFSAVYTDPNVTNKIGIIYADDYSSTFVDESLVTKRYVDNNKSFFKSQTNLDVISSTGVNGEDTGITVDFSTNGLGNIIVLVNNLVYIVENNKTGNLYFSDDSGVNSTLNLTSGNTKLYWNSVIADYNLLNGVDKISILYL